MSLKKIIIGVVIVVVGVLIVLKAIDNKNTNERNRAETEVTKNIETFSFRV